MLFDDFLKKTFTETERIKILEQVVKDNGSCQNVFEISEKDRKTFLVAGDLTPMEHLKSLAIIANNTSLSCSKTINMPETATREEISDVYKMAHKMGVIGTTVYRDKCRIGILTTSNDENHISEIKVNNAPKRPKKLPANLYSITVKGNKFGVIVAGTFG